MQLAALSEQLGRVPQNARVSEQHVHYKMDQFSRELQLQEKTLQKEWRLVLQAQEI